VGSRVSRRFRRRPALVALIGHVGVLRRRAWHTGGKPDATAAYPTRATSPWSSWSIARILCPFDRLINLVGGKPMAACEVGDRLASRLSPIYGQFTKLLGKDIVVRDRDRIIIC